MSYLQNQGAHQVTAAGCAGCGERSSRQNCVAIEEKQIAGG